MEKVRDLITRDSGIIFMIVLVLILVLIAVVAVTYVIMTNSKSQTQSFKEMPDESENLYLGPIPSDSMEKEDGETRKFFPVAETGLRSYQLEFVDADYSKLICKINMSERIIIGRKNTCTVSIPNHTLSGEHCEILLKEGKLFIHDLNSLNGTFLNGSPDKVGEEELVSGSRITMGQVNLIVHIFQVH